MATRQETNQRREALKASLRQQSQQHAGEPVPLAPIRQLADIHQLSTPIVSEVLKDLTSEGVLITVPRVGTFVVSTRSNQQRCVIGVSRELLEDPLEPYWSDMVRGITDGANEVHAEVSLLSENTNAPWERVAGLIVAGNGYFNAKQAPKDFPVVSLIQPNEGATTVCADDYSGARRLTERLLALGHRRIAVIYAGDRDFTAPRLQGYRDALEAADINPMTEWLSIDDDFRGNSRMYIDAGYETVQRWLATNWRSLGCTALLAHNDPMAVGAIQAFREAGLRVPADISVAGFDGNPAFAFFEPELTTVRIPLREIGQLGVELLLRQMNGEKLVSSPLPLAVTLIPGKSCGPCP